MFPHLLIWIILLYPILAHAQSDRPVLQTARITAYDINEGLPVSCAWEAFLAEDGRLWINPCFQQEEHQQFGFLQYDGKQSRYIDLGNEARQIKGQAVLSKLDKADRAIGYFRHSNTFFIHDLQQHTTSLISTDQPNSYILSVFQHKDGHLVILAIDTAAYFIYSYQDSKLNLLQTIARKQPSALPLIAEHAWLRDAYVLNGDHLWMLDWKNIQEYGDEEEYIIRVNLQNGEVHRDLVADFFDVQYTGLYNFNWAALGNTIQSLDISGRLFVYDLTTGQSTSRQLFPNPHSINVRPLITTDKSGNTLYAIIEEKNKYALLIDLHGQEYDYSQVLTRLNDHSRYPYLTIKGMYSHNFLQTALAVSRGGIMIADLMPATSIQSFITIQPTRGIGEFAKGELLIFSELDGVIRLNTSTKQWSAQRSEYPFDGLIPIFSDIRSRPDGKVWYMQDSALVSLDEQLRPIKHPLHMFIDRYEFINDSLVVIVTNKQLYVYNTIQRKLRSLIDTPSAISSQASFNQIIVARNGDLWIAGYDGLWHVDMVHRTSKVYTDAHGLSDRAVMCVTEDAQGRIWAGTYSGGVNILDPVSGSVKTINTSQGLSNNTVVGILQDEEGIMWLSTYIGITLLSPDGQVRARLYKEDGLSTNEFNRYSTFKTRNGDLIFGSVEGINRIRPADVKRDLFNQDVLKIYGNTITYYDPDQEHDVERSYGNAMEVIRLPATHRYLTIKFAMSVFVNPQDHQYYYRFVNAGNETTQDWISIGPNTELTLNNLPVGDYTIEIKGKDYRGNSTLNPLQIHIEAADFFYRSIWFYALLAMLVVAGAMVWIFRERKERIRLEQVVSDRTRKIREDKETIEQQSAKLIELDQAKSIFFTNISHEFRTPLTVIEGMTEHVKDDPNAPRLIRRNARHLLNLVNQILDLRKIESGAMTLQMEQRDVMRFIRYITESYRSLAHVKNIDFKLQISPDKLMMDIDVEKLRQIIVNLLSNAIKYTPSGSSMPQSNGDGDFNNHDAHTSAQIEMTVSTYAVDKTEWLEIKVADKGIGIPQDLLKDIFNRFYQVEQLDKQKLAPSGGTGIGLTIVAEFVSLMKGKIEVQSEVGKGSTFIVKLPVTREASISESTYESEQVDDSDLILTSVASVQEDQGSENNAPTLLIIEDNADVIYFLQATLRHDYQIKVAQDGKQGLAAALDIIPDLIICDVMMPEMDGFEVCDALKKDVRTSHVPVLMLTGKTDDESRITGLKRGADAYISKPFDVRILLAQLSNLYEARKRIYARYASLELPHQPSEDPALQTEDNFIMTLREIIEAEMHNEDLQVPDIAQAIGMSRANLHRKVTALTGKPVTAFIRTVRLNKAKQLLQDPSFNVSQVGYEVGFKYPETFTRAFTDEFGMTPSQWRTPIS